VPTQARPKIRVVPCRSSCRDPRHGTALAFVSCRHGPKFIVSCRASGRATMSCFVRPINSTAQVQALVTNNNLRVVRMRPHQIPCLCAPKSRCSRLQRVQFIPWELGANVPHIISSRSMSVACVWAVPWLART
jgi:hypothetical protein